MKQTKKNHQNVILKIRENYPKCNPTMIPVDKNSRWRLRGVEAVKGYFKQDPTQQQFQI
jgi:hypothetical protein